MITPGTFFGYPGQVWQASYQALNWLSGQLASGTAPAYQQASAAQSVFQTLRNGVASVAAWQTGAALNAEVQNLIGVQAVPVTLDPTTLAYYTARIAAVSAAASGIAALPQPISVTKVPALLAAGQPAITAPKFLTWCMTFTGETPPVTGTALAASLPAYATAAATAWNTTAMAIAAYSGNNLTGAYDTAARMYRTSAVIAGILNSLQSGGFAPVSGAQTLWSQTAALPAILLDAGLLSSPPNTLQNQQCGVIRFALTNMSVQLAQFLLALRQPVIDQINLAGVRSGDTLMDIAARSVGNFEQWSAIATLNGLYPPYPGADNTSQVGQQLLLPGTTGSPVSGAPVATYAANILGTDYDFGPINTPNAQPAWGGDIATITGLLNFARALGRRLQTPVGSLIYHVDYGSRIPAEVGAIQSQNEAARLAAFGESAIAADPRTGTIVQSSASVEPGFLASYQAQVIPIGPSTQPVSVNETLSPLP